MESRDRALLRPAGARQFRGGREADSFGGMNRAETIHHRSFQSKGRGHDRFPHRTRIAGETRLDGDLRPRGMRADGHALPRSRSEEHTSELQSLMRISYAVFF